MENSPIRNRIAVACIIAANTIRTEDEATPNHANRLVWAAKVFASPAAQVGPMLRVLVAANHALPIAQIADATDEAIQAQVDAAVDLFATGA
jgi:hypothetical protein